MKIDYKKFIGFAACIIFLACSGQASSQNARVEVVETAEENITEPINDNPSIFLPMERRFVLTSETLLPGTPFVVAYHDNFTGEEDIFRASLVNSAGRRLSGSIFYVLPMDDYHSIVNGTIKVAILGVPNTALPGTAYVRIESDGVIIEELPVTIDSRDFFSQTLTLSEQNTEIRTAPNPQRTLESEQLWAIIARTGNIIYDTGPFIVPVNSSRITSNYGDRRVYIYHGGGRDTTVHAGIDYGVPTGTPVLAAGRGMVVLAQYRIVTGYTVILEHMPGIYSLYYHMDSLSVSPGQVVEKLALIGLSGSTGLSTGPHLHWEFRVSTEYIDPLSFINMPILDKTYIINKLLE